MPLLMDLSRHACLHTNTAQAWSFSLRTVLGDELHERQVLPLAFGVAADQSSALVWSAGLGAAGAVGYQHHLSVLSLKPDMVGACEMKGV